MKSWKLGAGGAVAAGLLLLAGCGTGGQGTTSQEENAPGAASETRDLSYAVVIHGNPDGSFWNVVKRGAEDAAKQYGVQVEVTGNVEGTEQAKLIDAAAAKNPTGLVVSMANPDALQSALASAKSKNIPFVTINSGADKSAEFGAISHVGQTETVAGRGAGQQLKQAGGTNLVCLIHEAGNIGLEQRCKGAAETFGGQVQNLQVDLNNPQGIQSTVKSKLLGDKSINAVLALNPDVATATLAGVKDAGSSAKVGAFDINADVLTAIGAGEILFTVDQQQHSVGGGQAVLTGPAFVTKDNVGPITDLVGKGTR